jgi:hypothetical protein
MLSIKKTHMAKGDESPLVTENTASVAVKERFNQSEHVRAYFTVTVRFNYVCMENFYIFHSHPVLQRKL